MGRAHRDACEAGEETVEHPFLQSTLLSGVVCFWSVRAGVLFRNPGRPQPASFFYPFRALSQAQNPRLLNPKPRNPKESTHIGALIITHTILAIPSTMGPKTLF